MCCAVRQQPFDYEGPGIFLKQITCFWNVTKKKLFRKKKEKKDFFYAVNNKCCPSILSTRNRRSADLGKAMKIRRNHLSFRVIDYFRNCMSKLSWTRYARPHTVLDDKYIDQIAQFQGFYVKSFFSSLRSPSYSFEQQINRPIFPFQVLYDKFYLGSLRSP
jgi:hypothetical protein